MIIVRERSGEHFDAWLSEIETSQIPELHRVAHNLFKDKKEVVAELTQIYSNDSVEAQVHMLKLVKRSMFGCTKLPPLKQRLLQML